MWLLLDNFAEVLREAYPVTASPCSSSVLAVVLDLTSQLSVFEFCLSKLCDAVCLADPEWQLHITQETFLLNPFL